MGVREALFDLRANAEPSRAPVLKVNVRESLRRRVNQISPETSARQVMSCLYPSVQNWHRYNHFDVWAFSDRGFVASHIRRHWCVN